MSDKTYSLAELAERFQLECVGDSHLRIVGLATLANAKSGQLAFLANPRYQNDLLVTKASAVIVTKDMLAHCPSAALVSINPYMTYAEISQLFAPDRNQNPGIHHSAVVSSSAKIATSATISAQCVIGDNVVIGENVVIGPGSVVGDFSTVDAGSLLQANVTIYHGVAIGSQVIIHSGCVIGSDGFGYAPSATGWQKIAQLGGVVIGDRVEIGANTTIDRGALDDTVIGNGVIIDNQVQIAHNVVIGDNSAIAGCVGIAGSAKLGKGCTLAGGVGIVGHIELADGVHITANTTVTKSIKKRGSYSSGTPMQETSAWHKSAVRFSQLNQIAKRVKAIEKHLQVDE